MSVLNIPTAYEHIKQYSQSPFTLECEVCQQVYPSLSVRSHLRTKKHQNDEKASEEFNRIYKPDDAKRESRPVYFPN